MYCPAAKSTLCHRLERDGVGRVKPQRAFQIGGGALGPAQRSGRTGTGICQCTPPASNSRGPQARDRTVGSDSAGMAVAAQPSAVVVQGGAPGRRECDGLRVKRSRLRLVPALLGDHAQQDVGVGRLRIALERGLGLGRGLVERPAPRNWPPSATWSIAAISLRILRVVVNGVIRRDLLVVVPLQVGLDERQARTTALQSGSAARHAATNSSRRIARSLRLQRLAEFGLPARAVH